MSAPDRRLVQALFQASAQRPRTVVALWLLGIAASAALIAALGGTAFTTTVERFDDSESVRAERLRRAHFPAGAGAPPANEMLVIRSTRLTVDDPAFRDHVDEVSRRLLALGDEVVAWGVHYYATADASLVSADRRTTLVPLALRAPRRDIGRVLDAVRETGAKGDFEAYLVGTASVARDYKRLAEEDLRAEVRVGLPVALGVLLVVFATVVAALVPVALAFAAIAVALAATALLGQAAQAYFLVTNMIFMMGLAVGIDYALFILARYREERARGRDIASAIAVSGETAGRAVLFSGLTVVLALLGLLLVPTNVFRSLAAGAIFVVLAAMLAAMTLLPAVLRLLGERIDALRVPLPLRWRPRAGTGGMWDRLAQVVMRYPRSALTAATALLLVAAAPALDLETGFSGIGVLPERLQSRQGFRLVQAQFDVGTVSSAIIVVEGAAASPVRRVLSRLRSALEADPAFVARDARQQVTQDGSLVVLTVPQRGDAESPQAQDGVQRLREAHVPAAVAGAPVRVLVTGRAAGYVDFLRMMRVHTPFVIGFVLALSFVLLAVAFRSLVVPLTAIAVNLLSVAAAYGLLVLVFLHGAGAALLGFQQVARIEAWIPLFLFTVLFGLSMDYHVFLLSRIREHFDLTGRTTESIAVGLRATAGVITGAALVMVAIFAGFAGGELVMFQQAGFGLAVAILLDASVVRVVLVPAAMALLGARNWILPGWLARRLQA